MVIAAILPTTPPTMAAVFELLRLLLGEDIAAEEGVGVGDSETLKGPRIEPGPCSGVSIKKNWSSCGKRKDKGEDAHHRLHTTC